jgi:hypothetical protein
MREARLYRTQDLIKGCDLNNYIPERSFGKQQDEAELVPKKR